MCVLLTRSWVGLRRLVRHRMISFERSTNPYGSACTRTLRRVLGLFTVSFVTPPRPPLSLPPLQRKLSMFLLLRSPRVVGEVAYTNSVPVKIGPARLDEFVEETIRSDAAIRADGLALFSYHPGVDGDDQARTVAGREVHQRPDHLGALARAASLGRACFPRHVPRCFRRHFPPVLLVGDRPDLIRVGGGCGGGRLRPGFGNG